MQGKHASWQIHRHDPAELERVLWFCSLPAVHMAGTCSPFASKSFYSPSDPPAVLSLLPFTQGERSCDPPPSTVTGEKAVGHMQRPFTVSMETLHEAFKSQLLKWKLRSYNFHLNVVAPVVAQDVILKPNPKRLAHLLVLWGAGRFTRAFNFYVFQTPFGMKPGFSAVISQTSACAKSPPLAFFCLSTSDFWLCPQLFISFIPLSSVPSCG